MRRLPWELLRDGQVRRAPALSPPAPRAIPTGLPPLDAALGGGLARGQLHEIVGPSGAGGTALVRAALASATQGGENCALIDPGDSFDPAPCGIRSEEHTSELQSRLHLVCRLLLEKKKQGHKASALALSAHA